MCGYILWAQICHKSLIFQAFFVFLLFQKKRIKGGKKFKRKKLFVGDFALPRFLRNLSGRVGEVPIA